ncbi:MAG: SnoaL-like polyketide cyclase [Pseudonocardiales bacterium]|nr:SnoaL-like polyketide cyclase [Pseudonocardiales bacterium]
MDPAESTYGASVFASVLRVWNGNDPAAIRALLTDDYRGHMLHLADGERTALDYSAWIERFRRDHPGVQFEVVSQIVDGDRVWSRLLARRPDGAMANGMNESRMREGLLAEEWALWSGWQRP